MRPTAAQREQHQMIGFAELWSKAAKEIFLSKPSIIRDSWGRLLARLVDRAQLEAARPGPETTAQNCDERTTAGEAQGRPPPPGC